MTTHLPDRFLTRKLLTDSVPVPTSSPYTYTTVAQLDVELEAGDYVQLMAHLEGTNDLGYDVMFARQMKEGQNSDPWETGSTNIARRMGTNITPDIHHGMLEVFSDFQSVEKRVHSFRLVCYAASTAADPGDRLTMSYVEMRAAVWRINAGTFLTFNETEFGSP